MTPSELEAIEKRAEAATKGPWATHWERRRLVDRSGVWSERGIVADRIAGGGTNDDGETNAAFIAHAREDVPALVLEVRRLRGVLAEIRTIIETEADDAAACQLAVDVVDRELPEEAP